MAKKKTAKKTAKKVTVKAKSASAKASSVGTSYRLNEGDSMPQFRVSSTSGAETTASDLKGRLAVIYFYPKDNTPGCTLEGMDFKRLHAKFKAIGCDVYGVSKDSLKAHDGFRSKCGFPFDLLSDESGAMCSAFDVIQMKSLYGRKFEGIERSTFVVDSSGRVARIWRKVKVAGHAEQVLDFVKGLK